MRLKIILLFIATWTVGSTLVFRAWGQEDEGTTPTFHLRPTGVQVEIAEALGANPPQALLTALKRYPKIRHFRVIFHSNFAGDWGGIALYDRQAKTLRLDSISESAEYTWTWKYLFKSVSVIQLKKLAQVKREQGSGSAMGYFEELQGLGCPTSSKETRRP